MQGSCKVIQLEPRAVPALAPRWRLFCVSRVVYIDEFLSN
jgi:hypothetical protein